MIREDCRGISSAKYSNAFYSVLSRLPLTHGGGLLPVYHKADIRQRRAHDHSICVRRCPPSTRWQLPQVRITNSWARACLSSRCLKPHCLLPFDGLSLCDEVTVTEGFRVVDDYWSELERYRRGFGRRCICSKKIELIDCERKIEFKVHPV